MAFMSLGQFSDAFRPDAVCVLLLIRGKRVFVRHRLASKIQLRLFHGQFF
jgi:hypothetical protein